MIRDHSALKHHALQAGAHVASPPPRARLTPESPALEAMTDLRRITAATITPDRSIVECNALMKARAIRLLFVESTRSGPWWA